ncbi:MAG TPA: RNA-binding S4 domain-containing protein [Actinomycetospora sp.]|uniref:RNA-binding S4 domain-containing protein n=1 Tax=Actinomycetospora sp. TaxID=1872135 RepID=UPI002F42B40A
MAGTIRLGQFLKLSGLVEHGADAKDVVAAGEVAVNGRAETRRGRQLAPGDVVALGGERARVVGPYGPKRATREQKQRNPGRRPGGPGGTTTTPGSAEMSPAERSEAEPPSA